MWHIQQMQMQMQMQAIAYEQAQAERRRRVSALLLLTESGNSVLDLMLPPPAAELSSEQ